jgi:hypothetical protein
VHKACDQQVHSETGQTPRQRVGGRRPGRSAGRRAAAGGARLDGACHRAAPEPAQNSYSHFAGGAAPETILVGNGHTPAPLRRNGSPDSPDDSGGRPGEVVGKMFRVGTMRLLSCRSGRR